MKSLFFKIIKGIGKKIELCLFYVVNFLRKKKNDSILLIPHENCKIDNYDILNSHSDNVLCFFDYILKNEAFNSFKLYLCNR